MNQVLGFLLVSFDTGGKFRYAFLASGPILQFRRLAGVRAVVGKET